MNGLPGRRAVAVGLLAYGLLACGKQTDPIEQAIQSVKDRSVPPGGQVFPSYRPWRERDAIRASWEIETNMAWDAYSAWVTSRLPEFEVRQNDGNLLRLSQPLAADIYTLTFRTKHADKGARVEATFESRPF